MTSAAPPWTGRTVAAPGLTGRHQFGFRSQSGHEVELDPGDVIAVPANLPLFPRPEGERPVEIALAQATAHVNKVWVAVCDRAKPERGVEWTGASCIVDPDGWLAAGPVPDYGIGLLDADVDFARSRNKAWGQRNDVVGDLRPELYSSERPASDPSRIASSSERGESRSPTSTAP